MPAADETPILSRQRRQFLIAAAAGLAVFVLVAILMRTGVLDSLDTRVAGFFAAHHRRQPFTGIAETLDKLDTWWLLILLVAAIVGGLWWSGRMAQGLYVGVTIAAALIVNPLLKVAFQRQPPGDSIVKAAVYAFPSGHTTTATATATALAVVAWPTRWRWPVVAVAALFSLAMGVSRVYLAAHWTSDVLGGWALGFTIAMAVRTVVPWPSPEEVAAVQAEDGEAAPAAGGHGPATTALAGDGKGINVVFLDWGNTLMVDNGMREGPMKDWEKVEAEAGAQEALRRLRAHYRLIVATNAADSPGTHVRMALARVGLDELVDDVVSSADVGDHKPNYAFFRAALLREGTGGLPLDPRRAVMVGDGTSNDIAGAQRAGMRTIWYNPTKRRFPDGAQPPDVVIRKLAELPAAVDRLAGFTPEKRSRKQRKAEAAEERARAADTTAATAALRAETAAENAATSAAAALPQAEQPAAPAQQAAATSIRPAPESAAPDPGVTASEPTPPAGPETGR